MDNATGNNYIILQPYDGVKLKDELQTVPVHPAQLNGQLKQSAKSSGKKVNGGTKSGSNKIKSIAQNDSTKMINSTASSSSLSSMNEQQQSASSATVKRRDTADSSTTTYSSQCYSPSNGTNGNFNEDTHDFSKLEKKRERNREAARKCRTRKLEKIATLELQVKNLTETNELQKAKTKALTDEINQLKLKFESHQKQHNCDLKFNFNLTAVWQLSSI